MARGFIPVTYKKKKSYSRYILFALLSIAFKIIDFGNDTRLIYQYWKCGEKWYSFLTFIFMFLPALMSFIMVKRILYKDRQEQEGTQEGENCTDEKIEYKKKISDIIATCFSLLPVAYDYDVIDCARKARGFKKQNDIQSEKLWSDKMMKTDYNNTLLKVIESLLEAASQVILQLVIRLNEPQADKNIDSILQVGGITISILGIAFSIARYNCSREDKEEDQEEDQEEDIIIFTQKVIVHAYVVGSRILCIGAIASEWPLCTISVCIFHCLAITTWVILDSQKISDFYTKSDHDTASIITTSKEKIYLSLFLCVFGITFLYTSLNIFHKRVKKEIRRESLFYTIFSIENVIAVLLWFNINHNKPVGTFGEILIFCTSISIFSIVTMILNYTVSESNVIQDGVILEIS